MQVKSIHKYARISAFKAREVTRSIQGLPATDAMNMLRFVPRKAARLVEQTLASAIANAENNNNLAAETLVVQEAVVGEGPTFKRFRPKARGSAGPIHKRTSHIRIILTDEIEIKRREDQPRKKKSKKTEAKAAPKKKSLPAENKAAAEVAAPVKASAEPAAEAPAAKETQPAETKPEPAEKSAQPAADEKTNPAAAKSETKPAKTEDKD